MPPADMVVINTNIEISGQTLQKVVATAKQITGPDAKGHFRIDTADLVSHLVWKFLIDAGFDTYASDRRHYESVLTPPPS